MRRKQELKEVMIRKRQQKLWSSQACRATEVGKRRGGVSKGQRGVERDCCRKASRGDYSLGKWVTLEMLI